MRAILTAFVVCVFLPRVTAASEGLEVWPSLRSAAKFLGGRVASDLRDQPVQFEPKCIVRSSDDDHAEPAADAISLALAENGFDIRAAKDPADGLGTVGIPVVHVETRMNAERHVVLATLGRRQYRAAHLDKVWVDLPAADSENGRSVRLKVVSTGYPDVTAAADEANSKLESRLLSLLVKRAHGEISRELLARNLPRLFALEGARRDRFTETVNRPYGTIFRQHLLFETSEQTIDKWMSRLVRERQCHRRTGLAAGAATFCLWVFGFFTAIKLDRWTRGYRRHSVVVGTLAVFVAATVAGWLLLLI